MPGGRPGEQVIKGVVVQNLDSGTWVELSGTAEALFLRSGFCRLSSLLYIFGWRMWRSYYKSARQCMSMIHYGPRGGKVCGDFASFSELLILHSGISTDYWNV